MSTRPATLQIAMAVSSSLTAKVSVVVMIGMLMAGPPSCSARSQRQQNHALQDTSCTVEDVFKVRVVA